MTHVCQIMYENQIYNTKTSINNVLTTAHCASVRPHNFHKRLKVLLQPSRSSSRLLTSCCLHWITDWPMHPVRWGHKPQTSLLHTLPPFYLHYSRLNNTLWIFIDIYHTSCMLSHVLHCIYEACDFCKFLLNQFKFHLGIFKLLPSDGIFDSQTYQPLQNTYSIGEKHYHDCVKTESYSACGRKSCSQDVMKGIQHLCVLCIALL